MTNLSQDMDQWIRKRDGLSKKLEELKKQKADLMLDEEAVSFGFWLNCWTNIIVMLLRGKNIPVNYIQQARPVFTMGGGGGGAWAQFFSGTVSIVDPV